MATCEFLLLEDGNYLLLEDSGRLIIGDIPCDAPSEGGASASGGHPWPQKLVNLLDPVPVMLDDEDLLLILDD